MTPCQIGLPRPPLPPPGSRAAERPTGTPKHKHTSKPTTLQNTHISSFQAHTSSQLLPTLPPIRQNLSPDNTFTRDPNETCRGYTPPPNLRPVLPPPPTQIQPTIHILYSYQIIRTSTPPSPRRRASGSNPSIGYKTTRLYNSSLSPTPPPSIFLLPYPTTTRPTKPHHYFISKSRSSSTVQAIHHGRSCIETSRSLRAMRGVDDRSC